MYLGIKSPLLYRIQSLKEKCDILVAQETNMRRNSRKRITRGFKITMNF